MTACDQEQLLNSLTIVKMIHIWYFLFVIFEIQIYVIPITLHRLALRAMRWAVKCIVILVH